MYLKKLKVRNFKSFAGSTEIPFEPGFTGVAGPNGMGKSNISDAILFVLGPTSSKALRADRLTHLFFNGGATKKPATECEVSLVFDNQDRMLPLEAPEVEITRYVKLIPSDPDGYYSYFYVNGKRTTQGEIDSLLSHARLSGDGYNLVQQGDVNKIVSMGPVPRRQLVERLAGISQYDEELDRAQAKRTDLEANLDRIRTLLGEIKTRLAGLESQRLQAIQYNALVEERRKTEARLARAGHLAARQEVATRERQLADFQAQIERLQGERNTLLTRRAAVEEGIARVEREMAEIGGERARKFQAELNDRRLAVARLETALAKLHEGLEELEQRARGYTGDLERLRAEARCLEATEASLAQKLSELDQRSAQRSQEAAGLAGDSTSRGKLASSRKQVLELERKQTQLQDAWQTAVQNREAAKGALDTAERTQAQAEDDHRTREVEIQDLLLQLKEAQPGKSKEGASTAELQKQLFTLRSQEKSLSEATERLGRELLELNRRYSALDARLKARGDPTGRSGPRASVDFLLSQRNLGKINGIRGTVEELASFDAQHRTALQVAAGSRFQALVVENDQVAEECIRLLRQEKRGRATFLPLNKMLSGRPHGKALVAAHSQGSAGFAIDLVKFDETFRPAFWYVFGETVVMDDLAHARDQMGGVRLVTLQGDLIEATGAITGGFLDTTAQGRGADSPAELKRVGEELREKSAAESAAREQLQQVTLRLRETSEELARRSIEDSKSQGSRESLERELAQSKQRLRQSQERIAEVQKERSRAEAALRSAESRVAEAAQALTDVKSALQSARESYLGQLPENLSSRLRALQEEMQAASAEHSRVNGELEGVRASLRALRTSIEEKEKLLAEAESTRTARRKEVDQATREMTSAREALEGLRSVETKQSDAVREQAARKKELDAELVALAGTLGKTEQSLVGQQDLLHREEAQLAAARAHLQEVEAALSQLPEPDPSEPAIPVDELQRNLAQLSRQIEGMGSVNQKAVEEYDTEKTRWDEFEAEVQRLTEEKTELLSLVQEIETKKREKIVEIVGRVNTAYQEIYQELSAGGHGEIVLENPKDPLAGGLLIRASPTGKVVQRLEQLSGGEKSLASLAFIFAVQRHDPSPLYVFDEVDMSLDGINSEYVGRMLRHNAEKAQFIVISLRKVTLKFAHRIFGVTMRGDGCSRVVGLRLEDIRDVDERDGPKGVNITGPMEAR
jgi:chromosome segregation protein